MKQFKRKFIRSNKGAALTELVLVVPLLLLMIGIVFEIGRVFYIKNVLEYSSKKAARIGASIKESVDETFMGKGTISKTELENLIVNSVRVSMVIEDKEQFMIRYLNKGGNEVMGVVDLPFDRQNNPGSIEYVEVEISYPGQGQNVNSPIPLVFNPGNLFNSTISLSSRAVFQIEGRLERNDDD